MPRCSPVTTTKTPIRARWRAPPLAATAASEPPLPPRFAFVRAPAWKLIEPVMSEAFAELVDAMGEAVTEIELGSGFDNAIDLHRTVMEVDMAHNLHRDYEKGGDQLSDALRAAIERGRGVPAVEYLRAVAAIATLNAALDDVFNEYDALITPSAPGEAPHGMPTGNPAFCSTWTYLGTPAISLPLMATQQGMPLGVQLIGRRDNDARLLRTARWLVKTLGKGASARSTRRRKGKS